MILYHGDYLPDDDSLEVLTTREHYRNIFLATVLKCTDQLDNLPEEIIDVYQRSLTIQPLSEPLYRRLIAVYLSQGNRDMAEVTMERCRILLKRHLDRDIADATVALLDKV